MHASFGLDSPPPQPYDDSTTPLSHSLYIDDMLKW